MPADEIEWDSAKRDDNLWRIKLGFVWNGHTRNAEWIFDPRRRHITPHDDEAMRLSAGEYDRAGRGQHGDAVRAARGQARPGAAAGARAAEPAARVLPLGSPARATGSVPARLRPDGAAGPAPAGLRPDRAARRLPAAADAAAPARLRGAEGVGAPAPRSGPGRLRAGQAP